MAIRERYFNSEQEAHMRYLGSVPREQLCPSGWHVKAYRACTCIGTGWCDCRHVEACHADGSCSGAFNLIDRADKGRCPCTGYRRTGQEGRGDE